MMTRTLRWLFVREPWYLDGLGDLTDKPFDEYTADDWRQVIPLLQESTELAQATTRHLQAEIKRIEGE